jgi:hypothetical protein
LRQHFKGKFSELKNKTDMQILKDILNRHIFPNDDIRQKVDNFKNKKFTKNMIGVHVRFTDMKTDAEKIMQTVDKIFRKGKSAVFLATDSKEMVGRFRRKYGEVITTKKWYPPANERMHTNRNCLDREQNGREALVDMYLLAQCNSLVYSGKSSFGRLAELLSKSWKIFNINGQQKMRPLKLILAKYF